MTTTSAASAPADAPALDVQIADAAAMDVPVVEARSRRASLRWVFLALLVVVLGAEFTFAAPYVSNALGELREVSPWWVLAAVATQVSSMMAFTRAQRRMLAAGGAHVPFYKMATLVWAANAVNATLPAGSALSWQYEFRKLRSWGATVPAAGFTLLASGILSGVTFVGLLVVGAAGSGVQSLIVVAVVAVLVIAPAWFFWRRRPASVGVVSVLHGMSGAAVSRSYRLVRRSPENALAALERFVTDLTAIRPRRRDWAIGFGLAAMNWVADFVCLLACCVAVGVPNWTVGLALVAFIAGKSASSVTFLPGGLGVVDATMILAFTAGGVPTVGATAGVVLYRLISLVLVVGIGWLAAAIDWASGRHVLARARDRVEETVVEPVKDVALPVLGASTPALATDVTT